MSLRNTVITDIKRYLFYAAAHEKALYFPAPNFLILQFSGTVLGETGCLFLFEFSRFFFRDPKDNSLLRVIWLKLASSEES